MKAFVATVVLAGLFTSFATRQLQVSDVMLAQASSNPLTEYKDQGLIGAEGGVVYIENDAGEEIAFVALESGFLKEQVLVTLQELADAPAIDYEYLKFDEDEVVTPIGPRVAISFPFSAIDITSEAELIFFAPPYEGMYDSDNGNVYKLEYSLGQGQVFFTNDYYFFLSTPEAVGGGSAATQGAFYNLPPFSDNPPETYQLIAQPVSVIRH
ncbi:MAG: hypothetical protein AAF708_13350 [Deinococcota bacterium]